MDFDIIVVGGGLSGLISAAAAAEAGRRVCVVSCGTGDLLNFSGCIDLIAYHPGGSTRLGPTPAELMERLAAEIPQHPYTLVGKSGIERAIGFFKSLLPEGEYSGDIDRLIQLPTAIGTIKPTGLVPRSMAAGALDQGGEMLVVGFQGLRDFSAPYMAPNLAASLAEAQLSAVVRGETVAVDALSRHGGATVGALARRLEDEALLGIIAEKVRPLVGRASRVGFPTILGFMKDGPTRQCLEERLGARVFEIPGLPPSVPGQRLANHIQNALNRRGVCLMLGDRALGAQMEGQKCRSIRVARHGQITEMNARGFILATGGIRNGGLQAFRSGIREPLFGLPVRQPSGRGVWFRSSLFDPEGHPLDRAGVTANVDLHPVDEEGRILLENVRVCGRILAWQDPFKEKSGSGVAIATGYKAGTLSTME
jgi:glycerol-3-phosphate dehydrogenase subunit B